MKEILRLTSKQPGNEVGREAGERRSGIQLSQLTRRRQAYGGQALAVTWERTARCDSTPYLFHLETVPSEAVGGKAVPSVTEVEQPGLEINGLRKVFRLGPHTFRSRPQPKQRPSQGNESQRNWAIADCGLRNCGEEES